MKSLLDIQQDIRKLEDKVQEISEDINSINYDIDQIRNSSEIPDIDYKKIAVLSRNISFGKHPISFLKNENAQKEYLVMLLQLIKMDKDEALTIDRMIFIHWILNQSRCDVTFEDLHIESLKIEKQRYFDLCNILTPKYKEQFVVDLLITASVGGAPNREIMSFITDMISMLGFSLDDAKSFALIAKAALCQSGNGFSRDDIFLLLSNEKKFEHYISKELLDSLKILMRSIEVSFHDDEVYDFKWKVKSLENVEKGDLIATHRQRVSADYNRKGSRTLFSKGLGNWETVNIYAANSGTIYQFRDNNTNYGVISSESDNKDSIKAWVKAKIKNI